MSSRKLAPASHPPIAGIIDGSASGTVTGATCYGPTSLVVRDGTAAGSILFSLLVNQACTVPLNVAFTKGLHVTQNTPSDVVLTIT